MRRLSPHHQALVVLAERRLRRSRHPGSAQPPLRWLPRPRHPRDPTRVGWLAMASVGPGAATWALGVRPSLILALDPSLNSGFDLVPTALTLIIGIVCCLAGFEIGSKHKPALAPELGGLVVGIGILAMHYVGLKAWHIPGATQWNGYGVGG